MSEKSKITGHIRTEKDGTVKLEFIFYSSNANAGDLNWEIGNFAKEYKISDMELNSIQLITEELIVSVLVDKLAKGAAMQFFVSFHHKTRKIVLGAGYGGSDYNPFDEIDNLFALQIIEGLVGDVQFQNETNTFNQLLITLARQENDEQYSELEALIGNEMIEASENQSEAGIFNDDVFDDREEDTSDGVKSVMVSVFTLTIIKQFASEEKITAEFEDYFSALNIDKRRITFDNTPTNALASIKSATKHLLLNIFKSHIANSDDFSIKINIFYSEDLKEVTLRFKYIGKQYNPFVGSTEDRGLKVIKRQATVKSFFVYNEEINGNELIIVLKLIR